MSTSNTGKKNSIVVILVLLLALIAAGLLLYASRHDTAQSSQSRPLDIGLGTSVATQDLPVIESTIEYLIDQGTASQPFSISEKTLDYGHEDHPSNWEDCIADAGLQPELVKDFRTKAHNSVLLPVGFGADLGVVTTKPTNAVGQPVFLHAFTRPGVSSDNSQALIFVEAHASMDGWGMHYLLEHTGAQWKVTRALCGWIS